MAQPDIHYFPNFEKYEARTRRRLETESIDFSLPEGFPKELRSSLSWDGSDPHGICQKSPNWLHQLRSDEIIEIENAVKHFLGLGLCFGLISPDTFPLPTLHQRLRAISQDVHNAYGFAILRGIPVENYNREENIVIFAGINSHVGSQRARQDHSFEGNPADVVLSHIKDLQKTASKAKIGSPAYTNDEQAFHNDSGDVIGLYVLEQAAVGGESLIASSWKVYNELAKERPDLVRTLSEDWTVDRRKPATPYIRRPVLYYQPETDQHPERILLQCSRGSFTDFGALPRSPGIPPITEAQAEALDALHFLAKKFSMSVRMEKGDIQYVNDFSILHSRAGFIDDSDHERHLLRMWFRDPENAWTTPTQLTTRWKGLYDGVLPEKQTFPLEPYVRSPMRGSEPGKKQN